MRVFVYWNLHRGLWSVKALEGPNKGRVIARLPLVLLTGAEGKVSEAGRQRVLRERKKNVHAGITGRWLGHDLRYISGGFDIAKAVEGIGDRITYNPYRYTEFVHTVDESKFEGSYYALLTTDRAVFVA